MKLSIKKPVVQGFESDKEVSLSSKPIKLNIGGKASNGTVTNLNSKPQYQGRTAADTKLYTPRTHVYNKPEMWIGMNADIFIEEEMWLYNLEDPKIYKEVIRYVPGVERIFMEILANAADNANMSRRMGTDAGKIEVLMDNSRISITNYGLPMPVEIHPDEPTKYVPEVSFGRLLTSGHYETERNESGTNGVGSKATNIFSKEFSCIVVDHIRQLKYTQTWINNMREVGAPLIEKYTGKISSVQIIYKMDFTRFGYPEPEGQTGGYPKNLFHLFSRHVLDTSFNAKIITTFNGLQFNVPNIRDYGRLYFGDLVESAVVHYQWPAGTEVIKKKKGYQVAKDPSILPEVELMAVDTPDNSYHVSFANCLMTKNGGIHVNAAIKAVADSTVKMINEEMFAKLGGEKKGKGNGKVKKGVEVDAKEKKAFTININDVKPHISILLSVKVKDPKFDGQEKTKLTAAKPPPKIIIPEESLKIIDKWELINCLYLSIKSKQWKAMHKGVGKNGNVRTKKGVDANKAKVPNKNERKKCTLYITEGDSGAGYVEILSTFTPGGLDYIGILAMKGKGLNIMNATPLEIFKNREYNELNKMLGIEEGIDYMDDDNFDKLRYGGLMIAADSDVDGKHITALVFLYFHCRFPALLARGFIHNYLTPIIKVKFQNYFYRFYSEVSYEKWMRETPGSDKISADDHKYYKGLATSDEADTEADYKDLHVVDCFYDIDAPERLSLAFETGREDERKEWMRNWVRLNDEYNFQQQPISWFIDNELILHSLDNVNRTIPALLDGLKEGHRKIIYATHLQWKIGSKKKSYKEEKVAQFSGVVSRETAYHHGEVILGKTIVGMAQDYVGSNNIPYFAKKGFFGSRNKLGKNAGQTRYIYTHPTSMVSTIYNKKDKDVLEHIYEEGKKIEPKRFLPIIPMILVNGATGIGTGWSSYTPPHNPLDLIKCLRMLLAGAAPSDLPKLIPWYRNFIGTIEIINRKTKSKTIVKGDNVEVIDNVEDPIIDDSEKIEEDELPEQFEKEDKIGKSDKKDLYTMKITGVFKVESNGIIIISELPIGRAPFAYQKWLEDLVDEKKIKDFRNLCGKDKIYFEIHGFQGTPTHKNLHLETNKGLSNMVLLDENDKPVKYDDANQIMVKFYELRLPYYQKRKNIMIKKIEDDIITLNYKIVFFTEIAINKTINVVGINRATVHSAMDAIGVPREIYTRGGLTNISIEGIQELNNEIAKKQQEKYDLEQISIQQMMLTDLDEFERVYRREFKIKDKVIKLNTGKQIKTLKLNKQNIDNSQAITTTKTISLPKCPSNSNGKIGKQLIRNNKPITLNVNK